MSIIKDIIIRKFIETNDFSFVYNDKDVRHGTEEVEYFFVRVQKELQYKHNIIKTVIGLKNIWANMRRRFVNINLKKARFETVSPLQEEFYNSLIFLEDFIKHKNCDIFRTINRKEILNKQYDLLMGTEDVIENVEENLKEIEDFPDLRGVFQISTDDYYADQSMENIEFLEKDRNIIEKHIEKEKIMQEKENSRMFPMLDKRTAAESKLSICEEITKAAEENTIYSNEKLLVLSVFEKRNPAECILSGIRARNEMYSFIDKNVICEDIAKILNFVVNNEKQPLLCNNKLEFIFACISSFCENYI